MSDFKSYSLTRPPKYEKRYYRSKSLLLIDINNECGKRFKMKFDPQKLEHVSDNDLKIILKKLEMEFQSKTQDDFLLFVKSVWPDFIEGKHHIKYANQLQKVANGFKIRTSSQLVLVVLLLVVVQIFLLLMIRIRNRTHSPIQLWIMPTNGIPLALVSVYSLEEQLLLS